MIVLNEPVKALESDQYLIVLQDADDIRHFWKKDGTYDGYDKDFRKHPVKKQFERIKDIINNNKIVNESLAKTLYSGKKSSTNIEFFKKLSTWIINTTGNFNVAMRLRTLLRYKFVER